MSATATRMLTPRQEAMKLTAKQVSLPWVIYRRVSTKDQGEKYSPASQLKTLLRLAEEISVNVPEKFILSDMKSGRNEDRTDYQHLLQLAKEKQIGGALVLELSRVGRSVADSLNFRSLLKREGVAVVFALQQFDDTPQGKFMWIQYAAVAELEADLILQRTSKGRLQKAQEGKINDPHTYGYLYHPGVRLTGGRFQEGYIERHPVEADIVVRAFNDYVQHGSVYGLRARLNADRIPTKRNILWSVPALLKLLRNRMYIGEYETTVKGEDLVAQTVKFEILSIVDRALFEKAQVKLAQNRRRAGRPSKHYLLSSLIRCLCVLPSGKVCKRRWNVAWKGSYTCSNFYDERRCRLCGSKPIRMERFDRKVFDAVRDRLRDPETAYRLAKQYHADADRAQSTAVSVETRLARLKQRYENTENKLLADVPQRTLDKLAQQLREMEQERMALEVEARESAVVALPSCDRVVDTCKRMYKGLDGLKTFEEKRAFLLKTVEQIETDGIDYTVHCRIELLPAKAASGGDGKRKLGHKPVDYFAFVIRGKVA